MSTFLDNKYVIHKQYQQLKNVKINAIFTFWHNAQCTHWGLVVVSPLPQTIENILIAVNGLISLRNLIKRVLAALHYRTPAGAKKGHTKARVPEVIYENKKIGKETLINKSHSLIMVKRLFHGIDSVNNILTAILLVVTNLGLVVD